MRLCVLSLAGLAAILACVCLPAQAQGPKQDPRTTTPQGELIPSSFRSFLVTDGRYPEGDVRNRTGKIHCLVCEHGLAPVIAIFIRSNPDNLTPDRGVADLIKKTNDLIPKYRADRLAAFVTFLRLQGGTKDVTVRTRQDDNNVSESKVKEDLEYPDEPLEKREKIVESIRKYAKALNVPNVPFGLAADSPSKSVSQWGISDGDEVTVVLYYRMRLIGKPWTFKEAGDIKDGDVEKILKTMENEINTTRR